MVTHVLATVVFLGGLAGSAWLSLYGRSPDGVLVLLGTVAAACVIDGVRGRENRTKGPNE